MAGIPAYHRPVNTVFQDYALFPHLSVEQNIMFGLQMEDLPKREARKRAHEALELVRLPDVGARKPQQLSGGQQQRVALARALVKQPAVLLLDEPLGALDLKLRKNMQYELKALQRDVGITFIYVTHDQEEAITMADRIAVMNDGALLQVGTPREIYEHPGTHFVADFIGETNFIAGSLVERVGAGFGRVRLAGDIIIKARLSKALASSAERRHRGHSPRAHRHLHARSIPSKALGRRRCQRIHDAGRADHRQPVYRHGHALHRRASAMDATSSCACKTWLSWMAPHLKSGRA